MSLRPSSPGVPVWSRRGVLGAAVLVLAGAPVLAGCSGAGGTPTALATAPPDTVGLILDRHRAIRAAYAETAKAYPELDGLLAPLRDELAEHITAVAKAYARASAAPSANGTPAPSPAVPSSAAEARTALQQALQAAIPELHTLVGRTDAERAPLIGSVAASCACHVELLS